MHPTKLVVAGLPAVPTRPFFGIRQRKPSCKRHCDYRIGQGRRALPHAPVLLPREDGPSRLLSKADAKAALARFKVPLLGLSTADSPAQAAQKAMDLSGPVARKGAGLIHKTDAGALRLNPEVDEVAVAAAAMSVKAFMI